MEKLVLIPTSVTKNIFINIFLLGLFLTLCRHGYILDLLVSFTDDQILPKEKPFNILNTIFHIYYDCNQLQN